MSITRPFDSLNSNEIYSFGFIPACEPTRPGPSVDALRNDELALMRRRTERVIEIAAADAGEPDPVAYAHNAVEQATVFDWVRMPNGDERIVMLATVSSAVLASLERQCNVAPTAPSNSPS